MPKITQLRTVALGFEPRQSNLRVLAINIYLLCHSPTHRLKNRLSDLLEQRVPPTWEVVPEEESINEVEIPQT